MSTRRGANTRQRPQKHKNTTAFKNDLYDKRTQLKQLNAMTIAEVCEHCRDVIEWKIKYKKYKPLTQAKKCQKCSQRTVRKAYHVNCLDCALKLRICAKCNKSADEVNILPPAPTPQEQMKLDQEMQLLIKKLPERKRRTFLRYMRKGKKKQKEDEEGDDNNDGDSDPEISSDEDGENQEQENGEEAEKPKVETIPYTKEELLAKLEQMKLALANGDDFDDDFFGSDFDDEDDEDDFSDEEDEDEGSEEEDDDEDSEEEEDIKKVQSKLKSVTFDKGVKK